MKIKNCPNCNSPRIAKILYGYPALDDNLDRAVEECKIVLGGCCVTDNDPDYQCVECQALIYSKTGKFILNDEDEF